MTSKPMSAMAEDPKGVRLERSIITAAVVGPGYACYASCDTLDFACKQDHKHKQAVSVHKVYACQSAVVVSFEILWKVRHMCVSNAPKLSRRENGLDHLTLCTETRLCSVDCTT
jgi:hypothetical protein